MKPGLQRIEATLNRLEAHGGALPRQTVAPRDSFSFTVVSKPAAKPAAKPATHPVTAIAPVTTSPTSSSETVKPFPVQIVGSQTPALPKFKLPSFSSHRHANNPRLAMNLLKQLEETVEGWQAELQGLLLKIQELYLEGPIVDGWLESYSQDTQPSNVKILRHVEIDRLMDYVQEICNNPQAQEPDAPKTGYRLCGLDTDGKLWSRPCPAEQLPYVSLAIARYQKLRQFLTRKQFLEDRLTQLSKSLIALHSHLQEE